MALPASGAISLSQVNVELGVSATATRSLNDATTRTLFGVASGQISMSQGYGKANQFSFTISSNQTNANLRTLAVNAGWNQSSKVIATINSGVYVSSNGTGTPGLTVNGSFPGGVELVNNGFIVGMGGNGGTGRGFSGFTIVGGSGGAGGGGALSVSSAVTIQNNGTIAGGGGGGGGGNAYNQYYNESYYRTPGGGGGGGRSSAAANSSGGGGGGGGDWGAGSGGTGTVSGAGGGGAGGGVVSIGFGENGGGGGGWGSGGAGTSVFGGGSGGYAVSGNGNITWTATGTRLGSVG
jgi:hypothetical protein